MSGHERAIRRKHATRRARAARRAQTTRRARAAKRTQTARRAREAWLRSALRFRVVGVWAIVAVVVVLVPLIASHRKRVVPSPTATRLQIQRHVAAAFAGIPQHGMMLGQPTAPVTLQVFVDLEDVDCARWFETMLPPILEQFVRANIVRLEFHSFKTNTLNRRPFYAQQVAALAAGAQSSLWNYAATFLGEQGTMFTNYVTEEFLIGIAKQIPSLNLTGWEQSRTVAMAKIAAVDIQTARAAGIHDTPAFRIGLTGGKMKNFMGRNIEIYQKYIVHRRPSGERYIAGISSETQHPFSLIDVIDLKKALAELLR
jgi:protein-disulfide isomerase